MNRTWFSESRKNSDYSCFIEGPCRFYLPVSVIQFYNQFYLNAVELTADYYIEQYWYGCC